ncbi:MAG: metallophosphoesterase [Thermoleophilaceae bacterium]
MSLILHLSDLHLGSPSASQLDFTDKFGLEEVAGETKVQHLERTLRALGDTLRAEGRRLDAIVVSGDLTNANEQDGYDAFAALLDELGDRRPAAERVVVVPGNHDADWSVQPGDPKKFRRFLDTVRSSHRSPLLYGVDYDDSSLDRGTGRRKKAVPVLELDDVAIVALSSADFCGVEEGRTNTSWGAVLDSYLAEERASTNHAQRETGEETWKQAGEDLRRLRVQDMARVHPRQLDALQNRLSGCSLAHVADEDVRVRIAVLHHPIGPVSDHEEVKAFETLTNLAMVRSFLFDSGFHVVLHGHKHESYLGWEWLLPPGDQLDAIPWRTLVIGSPGDFQPGQTVCRLIETCPTGDRPVAGAPRLRLIDVPGVRATEAVSLNFAEPAISLAQPFVRSADIGSPWVVRARTADAAYQQLRDLPISTATPAL